MNTIRSLMSARSAGRRLVLIVVMVVAVIACLLAMHTVGGASHTSASSAATGVHHAPAEPSLHSGAEVEHCAGDCGGPSQGPDHSMLTMACVLALLAATSTLLAPALLARLATAPARAAWFVGTVGALPGSRPPSLIALSICRT